MTHPQKLSELLELTTASRHIAEHNQREAERVGAHQEFSDDGDTRGIPDSDPGGHEIKYGSPVDRFGKKSRTRHLTRIKRATR